MKFLKQSTAFIFRAGPFVDKTNGADFEVGLAASINQAAIQISKNGGAFGQTSAGSPTTTYDSVGHYQCPLTATDTNTLGLLRVVIAITAEALPVWHDFMVVPANVYESLVAGTEFLDVTSLKPTFEISGAVLSVKKTNGTDEQFAKTITTSAGANPITGLSG